MERLVRRIERKGRACSARQTGDRRVSGGAREGGGAALLEAVMREGS